MNNTALKAMGSDKPKTRQGREHSFECEKGKANAVENLIHSNPKRNDHQRLVREGRKQTRTHRSGSENNKCGRSESEARARRSSREVKSARFCYPLRLRWEVFV